MNIRNQLWCAWAGPLYAALFCLGLVIAGFIPPPSPTASAEELSALYVDHGVAIRIGLLIAMGAQSLYALFSAVVTVQLRRIEGPHSVLAFAQLGLGVLAILEVVFPFILQCVLSFRAQELSPETVRLLSDMCWMPFIGAWFTVVPQWIVTGIVILQDKRERPIFPRWAGYANLMVALLSLPSTGLYFLKTGPFAWNGLLAFWFAGAAFFGWTLFMAVVLVRAVREQAVNDKPGQADAQ